MHKKLAALPVSEFPHTFSFSTLALINHELLKGVTEARDRSDNKKKATAKRLWQPEFASVLFCVRMDPFAVCILISVNGAVVMTATAEVLARFSFFHETEN